MTSPAVMSTSPIRCGLTVSSAWAAAYGHLEVPAGRWAAGKGQGRIFPEINKRIFAPPVSGRGN